MSQIENVTQTTIKGFEGGTRMWLNMKEKQAITMEYMPRHHKATKKEKRAMLDEFTRLAGHHRKSAVRVLSYKPVNELTVYEHGVAVKFKPEKSVQSVFSHQSGCFLTFYPLAVCL
jgi:hypothetical protein